MKKTGPAAKDLTSSDDAKEFIEANNVAVIGFFKDQSTEVAKAFLSVAAGIDDIPFGITAEDGVSTQYEAQPDSIILFKKVCQYSIQL